MRKSKSLFPWTIIRHWRSPSPSDDALGKLRAALADVEKAKSDSGLRYGYVNSLTYSKKGLTDFVYDSLAVEEELKAIRLELLKCLVDEYIGKAKAHGALKQYRKGGKYDAVLRKVGSGKVPLSYAEYCDYQEAVDLIRRAVFGEELNEAVFGADQDVEIGKYIAKSLAELGYDVSGRKEPSGLAQALFAGDEYDVPQGLIFRPWEETFDLPFPASNDAKGEEDGEGGEDGGQGRRES